MRKDRKIRSDAYLANLPEDRQEQIAQWCAKPADRDEETNKAIPRTGGIHHAREQLAADGIKVSERSISEWFSDWSDARRLSNASRKAQNFEEKLKDLNPALSTEQVRTAGQLMFMSEAIEQQDAKMFFLISRLQMQQQAGELDRQKFKRETCEMFVKWSEDQRAKDILAGSGSRAEKIEQLGREMFGEAWDS